MKIKLSLLDNGLDFIIEALKPVFYSHRFNKEHEWKFSVLSFYSGVQLILKERLMQEHWSLIFEDISKANYKKLEQGDFQSVYHKNIIKRLNGICNVLVADKSIDSLRKLRNQFEHFEVKITIFECKKVIADVLPVLIKFWREEISKSCTDEQNEKFNKIKKVITDFDVYVENILENNQKEIDSIVSNGAGILIKCNECNNKSLVVFKAMNKKCKCFVCLNEITKEDYLKGTRSLESFLIDRGIEQEYKYTCEKCGNNTRVRYSQYTAAGNEKRKNFCCLTCLKEEIGLIRGEKFAKELKEKIGKMNSSEEVREFLNKELEKYK